MPKSHVAWMYHAEHTILIHCHYGADKVFALVSGYVRIAMVSGYIEDGALGKGILQGGVE